MNFHQRSAEVNINTYFIPYTECVENDLRLEKLSFEYDSSIPLFEKIEKSMKRN